MPNTPNLLINHVGDQAEKAPPMNEALDLLDKATQGTVAIDCSAGGVIVATNTQFLEAYYQVLQGTPGAAFYYETLDTGRSYVVVNETAQQAIVRTDNSGSPEVAVEAGQAIALYNDGAGAVRVREDAAITQRDVAAVDPDADSFLFWDASAAAFRRVLGRNLPGGSGGAGTGFTGALVQLGAPQTVNNDTLALLEWGVVDYDTSGFFAPSDPTELTVPAGVSKLQLIAAVVWEEDASVNDGVRQVEILKNGSLSVGVPLGSQDAVAASGRKTGQVVISAPLDVVAGDRFEVRVLHENGQNLAVEAGSQTWFAATVPGAGASTLEELSDVFIGTDLATGDVLTWTGIEWANVPPARVVDVLNDLSDVVIGTDLASGDFLMFDGANWVPNAPPGSLNRRSYRGALVRMTADQPILGTEQLDFGVTEVDTHGFHEESDPSRFTIPPAAVIQVFQVRLTANVQWADNDVGNRIVRIIKNGSAFAGGGKIDQPALETSAQNIVSSVVAVSPGDYFEVQVSQSSGGTLDVASGSETWFALEVVDPPEFPAADLDELGDVTIGTDLAVNDVLTWDGGAWINSPPAGGPGGASSLAALTDVDVAGTELADGDVLEYDAGLNKWRPGEKGGGSSSFRGAMIHVSPDKTGENFTTGFRDIPFNTADYDTDGMYAATDGPGFTVPAGVSKIRLSFGVFTDLGTASQYVRAAIAVNGTVTLAPGYPAMNHEVGTLDDNWFVVTGCVFNAPAAGTLLTVQLSVEADTGITVRDETWFAIEIIE